MKLTNSNHVAVAHVRRTVLLDSSNNVCIPERIELAASVIHHSGNPRVKGLRAGGETIPEEIFHEDLLVDVFRQLLKIGNISRASKNGFIIDLILIIQLIQLP